jgi:ADP-ribosylglycohydrolase
LVCKTNNSFATKGDYMLGAITGDVIGSIYEWNNIKTTQFPLFQERCHFTDDSVLSVALAEAILTGESYESLMRQYFVRYPYAGYGSRFSEWAASEHPAPYDSFGNGAAMRISPVAWAFDTMELVLKNAEAFTIITHNHPEGIKGAKATASSIFMGRNGSSKEEIRSYVTRTFGYDLSRSCDSIRPHYSFDESCQGTVPQAITAFLESTNFESAIRLAVSLGGDTDTLACITGGIAEAFYGGVPEPIAQQTFSFLDDQLSRVAKEFMKRFVIR